MEVGQFPADRHGAGNGLALSSRWGALSNSLGKADRFC